MPTNPNHSEQHEQLLLTMQGLPSERGAVPAELFIPAFDALRGLMGKIAEKQTGKKKSADVRLLVAELSHSSPVRGGISVVSTDGNGLARAITAGAEDVFLRVQGEEGDDIPNAELGFVESIVRGYRKNQLLSMKIQRMNGRASPYSSVEVTPDFVESLARIRQSRQEIRCVTTIAGEVEALDLHSSRIKLKIYPEIGKPVECRFHQNAREKALEAIGHRAAITGEARYRPDASRPNIQIPYRIDADANGIEIFEIGPDSPKISDFMGAFPNLTGGKPTLEYLRELRGED